MDFFLEEELLMLIPGLISGIPTGLFGIVTYVLTALAIYTLSRRRGLHKPWLAWVPVVNVWLLGSLSDQYQYVVKGENRSKRKWLLILQVIIAALTLTVVVLVAVIAAGMIFQGPGGDMRHSVAGPMMGILGVVLPLSAASIAYCVIRYMALYDVFRSMDPANSVLFLVLSILFKPTEPFFLFFSREKDLGMPPRKQAPVYEQTPVQEQDYVYETVDNTEYL